MRPLLLLFALTLLASPASAVQIALDGPSFSGLTTGTADEPAPGSQVTFTLGLAPTDAINGYQIEIAWDDVELSLFSAQQLFFTTALPFTQDPTTNGSSAGAVASVIGVSSFATTALFSVTFDVLARIDDGFDDFSFAAVGDGLSPPSVTLTNPDGANVAIVPEPGTPVLTLYGLAALAVVRRRRCAA